MPRSIVAPAGVPGVTHYKLSSSESWQLLAYSVQGVGPVGDDSTYAWFFETLAPTGQTISRDMIFAGTDYGNNAWIAGSAGAATMQQLDHWWLVTQIGGSVGDDELWPWRSVTVSPVVLTPNCLARVYAATADSSGTSDPYSNLATEFAFSNFHLWVEDVTNASTQAAQLTDVYRPILLTSEVAV